MGDTGAVEPDAQRAGLDVAIVSEARVGAVEARVHRQESPRSGFRPCRLSDDARSPVSPSDLAPLHLIISPPTAKLHATVMKWFADARVTPERVSTCNSLSVTVQAVVKGLGVALVPVRIIQAEVEAKRVKQLHGRAGGSLRTVCRSAIRRASLVRD